MQRRWNQRKCSRTADPDDREEDDRYDEAEGEEGPSGKADHSSDEEGSAASADYDEDAPEGADMAGAISFALLADLHQHPDPEATAEPLTTEDATLPATKAVTCSACGSAAKYTCPGCARRSCSLACVQEHKVRFACTGDRDMKTVIPLRNFTATTLSRDLHFIEDCQRVVYNCHKHYQHFWRYHYRALPPPLHALREAAKRRGVICQIISEGLAKRDRNTSRYDKKSDTLFWRCEFRVHSRFGEFDVATDWGSERFLLKDIFAHAWKKKLQLPSFHIQRGYNRAGSWINSSGAEGRGKVVDLNTEDGVTAEDIGEDEQPKMASSNDEVDDVSIKAKIDRFLADCAASSNGEDEGFSILHRAERLGTRRVHHHLNLHATLHDNLRAIFFLNEFPQFDVVRDEDLGDYDVATERERLEIRESFRKRPREEPPAYAAVNGSCAAQPQRPTRETMSDEQLARSARIPCRQYQRGQCQRSSEECPYLHCAAEDIPACRNIVNEGVCRLAGRCSFSHEPEVIARAKAGMTLGLRGRGRGRGIGANQTPAASMILHSLPVATTQRYYNGQQQQPPDGLPNNLSYHHHQQHFAPPQLNFQMMQWNNQQ